LAMFAPEEAEIFKDYLFLSAWFSIRLPLFYYDSKTICVFWRQICYIYSPAKVKHHLTCFNNIFSNPYQTNRKWNLKLYTKQISFRWQTQMLKSTRGTLHTLSYTHIMNLFQIGLLFSLPVHTYLLTCETGYWSIFIYVYMTGCVKCHVYFSTFVFANESWFFVCRVLSFRYYWNRSGDD
jgi:hypothetical protein